MKYSKVIFAHPTGNQNSRNVLEGLYNQHRLARFYTTMGFFEGDFMYKLGSKISKDFGRRLYPAYLRDNTTFRYFREVGRHLSLKSKFDKLVFFRDHYSTQSVFADFDKFVSNDMLKYTPNLVYAYADTALYTFESAKKSGIKCIYDMHGCYWREIQRIVDEERERNPEWMETVDIDKLSEDRRNRYDKELSLSDKVVVATQFCKDSIQAYHNYENIAVVPYGFPIPFDGRLYEKGKRLKILFVGNLSQMKGLSYMFDAVNTFGDHIDLTIIGSKPSLYSGVLEENLKKHNYLGTLPHDKVLEEMRANDVLLFPTLLDAFGMVITEAMSQGTPVIATNHSAGPELITNGEDGWVVDYGNSDAIKEIIERLLKDNCCEEIGRNALKKSHERGWQAYQNDICKVIDFV